MIIRSIVTEVAKLAQQYPIVTITGPRQSGKTTLAKATFTEKPYVNLENPEVRELALTDPVRFLKQYPKGAILDEVQRAPDLFSYLQVRVDENKVNGEFILTGSQQFNLHEKITQSLAGRTALLKLLPLSIGELRSANLQYQANDYMYQGFYPRIYEQQQSPTVYYRNYFETYVERDLRQLSSIKDLNTFRRFVKLCAGRIGQTINAESLSSELGITRPTVQHWLSILQASYLITLLDPYFENFGKRIIKSAKLYFIDVGLAAYMLDIESPQQLDRDPLRGALFENMVIVELMKYRYNQGMDDNLYFYRDQKQHEVDCVYKKGAELIPIEIKSSETFNSRFMKGIDYFKSISQGKVTKGYCVYAGEQQQRLGDDELIQFNQVERIFES